MRALLVVGLVPLAALAQGAAGASGADMANRRVFFGHQSVGENMLAGVAAVSPGIKVVETSQPSGLDGPAWAHAKVGQNEDPASKISHFAKLMDGGLGAWAEVAFYKFCYVDFDATTDVDKLFDAYRASHDGLRSKYPNTTFVHVTAPLTTVQRGAKGWLKNTFGSGASGVRENVRRHQFNELLRKTYGSTEPLFDLARLESTRPDGSAESFEREGRTYPALVPSYSNDGGHLNQAGRERVARELVTFLAGLPKR